MKTERFPDFFIIGAPKCGTTTVFDWLKQHPGTYLSAKEPSFFSKDLFDTDKEFNLDRTLESYLAVICPAEAAGLMTGEATPKYLYSDQSLLALQEHKERIKLIVMLRNPLDLCYSLHGQFIKQGIESRNSFADAWSQADAKDARLNYPMWGLFGKRLRKLFEMFDRDQVLVLILEEEMKNNPTLAYEKITKFLGLDSEHIPDLNSSNKATHVRFTKLNAFLNRFRRFIRRGGIDVGNTGVLLFIAKLNRAQKQRPQLNENLRKKMADVFRADVDLTASLLERDTLPWPDFFGENAGEKEGRHEA